ncbi:hypothetical protein [Acidisoma sp. 7E03]
MTAEKTEHQRPGKHAAAQEGNKTRGQTPAADSVDRTPNDEPTKQDVDDRVSREDEPRGHPTSDRFRTEQAHRKPAPDA